MKKRGQLFFFFLWEKKCNGHSETNSFNLPGRSRLILGLGQPSTTAFCSRRAMMMMANPLWRARLLGRGGQNSRGSFIPGISKNNNWLSPTSIVAIVFCLRCNDSCWNREIDLTSICLSVGFVLQCKHADGEWSHACLPCSTGGSSGCP